MTTAEITCFLPAGPAEDLQYNLDQLAASPMVAEIFITGKDMPKGIKLPDKACFAEIPALSDTAGIQKAARLSRASYTLIYTQSQQLHPGPFALERMAQIARSTGAGLVYADHYKTQGKTPAPHPLVDYQEGSLRDDFDFGPVLFYDTKHLKEAATRMTRHFLFAGLYDLRLKVSQTSKIIRVPEFLYAVGEIDTRQSGQKMFDYVDPKNREVQIEMEEACTLHLKDIGAWLKPVFKDISFEGHDFRVEASVIIPVRNRIKTIEDAIRSVFTQKTGFPFNIIVVDNHSTDGTTQKLKELAGENHRLIHVIPNRHDLGIGGCWNEGIFHEQCGKFAIQLDSDDLYMDEGVLQKIVDAFYEQNCAMVVGSYQMVNFKLEAIPPGLIDHKEWTPDNGRNNALRINGLGAPRAFFTPVLRSIRIPNVSYGEDYAVGLAISRHYQIGRIYEPLYLCRRWEDNTDASLDIQKLNTHNTYKDRIRTIELWARMQMNRS